MTEPGNRGRRNLALAGSLILAVILGWLEYRVRPGLSFLLLDLLPLTLASWFGGLGAGLLVAAVSAASLFANAWLVPGPGPDLREFAWSLATTVVIYVFAAWVLSALRKTSRALRTAGLTDPLTGLGTRPRFFDAAETELSRARRYKHPFSLVLMDVDGLAEVNRTSGHAAGDRVLAGLGGLLAAEIRRSDFAARVGEDEFAVWLPETRFEPAGAWMARVRERLPELAPVAGLPLTLTVAAVTFRLLPATAEEVLRAAEEALASAKGEERGQARHRLWAAEEAAASVPGPAPVSGPSER